MTRIDPFSLSTVPVEQYANNKKLRSATAFVWMLGDKYYLITNWHVVTGRNAQTHCLELPVRPEFLRGYPNVGGGDFWKEPIDIPLYNDGNPSGLSTPITTKNTSTSLRSRSIAFRRGI